jgi:DNA-binding PadR family transcriptional regulator
VRGARQVGFERPEVSDRAGGVGQVEALGQLLDGEAPRGRVVAEGQDDPLTSFALLGLLARRPMSGYDLAAYAAGSIARFWPIAKSQVYGELARLEELGYVKGATVAQERRPDKRTFALTPAGEKALDDWLDEPGPRRERRRVPLLVKVFFADRMRPERLAGLLGEARDGAEQERRALADIAERLAGRPELAAQRATARLGLRHAEATLAWLDEVEELLAPDRGALAPLGAHRRGEPLELRDALPDASAPGGVALTRQASDLQKPVRAIG